MAASRGKGSRGTPAFAIAAVVCVSLLVFVGVAVAATRLLRARRGNSDGGFKAALRLDRGGSGGTLDANRAEQREDAPLRYYPPPRRRARFAAAGLDPPGAHPLCASRDFTLDTAAAPALSHAIDCLCAPEVPRAERCRFLVLQSGDYPAATASTTAALHSAPGGASASPSPSPMLPPRSRALAAALDGLPFHALSHAGMALYAALHGYAYLYVNLSGVADDAPAAAAAHGGDASSPSSGRGLAATRGGVSDRSSGTQSGDSGPTGGHSSSIAHAGGGSLTGGRVVAWLKIPLVLALRPWFDYILYVDSDVVPGPDVGTPLTGLADMLISPSSASERDSAGGSDTLTDRRARDEASRRQNSGGAVAATDDVRRRALDDSPDNPHTSTTATTATTATTTTGATTSDTTDAAAPPPPLMVFAGNAPSVDGPCTGVFLVSCADESKLKLGSFLRDWWNAPDASPAEFGRFKRSHVWEQQVLQLFWRRNSSGARSLMRILPPKAIGDPESTLFTHAWSDGSDRRARLSKGLLSSAAGALYACASSRDGGGSSSSSVLDSPESSSLLHRSQVDVGIDDEPDEEALAGSSFRKLKLVRGAGLLPRIAAVNTAASFHPPPPVLGRKLKLEPPGGASRDSSGLRPAGGEGGRKLNLDGGFSDCAESITAAARMDYLPVVTWSDLVRTHGGAVDADFWATGGGGGGTATSD